MFSLCEVEPKTRITFKRTGEANVSVVCLLQLAKSVITYKSQVFLEGLVRDQEAYSVSLKKKKIIQTPKKNRNDVHVFLSAQQNQKLKYHSKEHEKQMHHKFAC